MIPVPVYLKMDLDHRFTPMVASWSGYVRFGAFQFAERGFS